MNIRDVAFLLVVAYCAVTAFYGDFANGVIGALLCLVMLWLWVQNRRDRP